jgi:hypothetical protein
MTQSTQDDLLLYPDLILSNHILYFRQQFNFIWNCSFLSTLHCPRRPVFYEKSIKYSTDVRLSGGMETNWTRITLITLFAAAALAIAFVLPAGAFDGSGSTFVGTGTFDGRSWSPGGWDGSWSPGFTPHPGWRPGWDGGNPWWDSGYPWWRDRWGDRWVDQWGGGWSNNWFSNCYSRCMAQGFGSTYCSQTCPV